MTDQLLDWVIVRSSTDVKDYAVLRPDLWANPLEKPLVTIYFTIVAVFYTENKIDSVACEYFLGQPEVPGRDHETMK